VQLGKKKKKKKLLVMVLLLTMGVLIYAAPAVAQHTNECPVGSSDQVGVAPHDYCNDTTFHNDRQASPGDTTQTINDITPIAQEQAFDQDNFRSGNTDARSDIQNWGDNSNLCPSVQQSGSTGNLGNQQGVEPFNSNFDEAELTGSTTEMSPTQSANCAPSVRQNAQNR
jgi:hypothetical protein